MVTSKAKELGGLRKDHVAQNVNKLYITIDPSYLIARQS